MESVTDSRSVAVFIRDAHCRTKVDICPSTRETIARSCKAPGSAACQFSCPGYLRLRRYLSRSKARPLANRLWFVPQLCLKRFSEGRTRFVWMRAAELRLCTGRSLRESRPRGLCWHEMEY